jgi:hypothetical protein
VTLHCAAPLGDDGLVVLGRDGGPEFLDSELARLGHLVALAASISRSVRSFMGQSFLIQNRSVPAE